MTKLTRELIRGMIKEELLLTEGNSEITSLLDQLATLRGRKYRIAYSKTGNLMWINSYKNDSDIHGKTVTPKLTQKAMIKWLRALLQQH